METFSALLSLWGGSGGHRWIPLKKTVTRGLLFSLIYAWTNGWVNNLDNGDLRPHRAHYVATVMKDARCVVGLSFVVITLGICVQSDYTFIHILLGYFRLFLCQYSNPRSRFINRTYVLPQDLVKFRSPEIGYYDDPVAQKFDRLCCRAACPIFDQLEKSKPKFRSFEASRNLAVRRPSA